jgi:hypothetical protein
MFIDRGTNVAIVGCTDLAVGLVNAGDLLTGVATCTWSVDIGAANSQSFTVGISVNNYYARNSTADDTVVTVSRPLTSNFITGGGYLLLQNPAGLKSGDVGSKNNFGFNVKYNKSGTNLQGSVNILVRRTENGVLRVYQIKGNAMTSLSVQPGAGTATFNGKANIKDVTDPMNPITIDGKAALQLVMTDRGDPGSADSLGITIWNKAGGVWFASSWSGTKTVEQTLGGGNLRVR